MQIGISGDIGSFSEEAAEYYKHKKNLEGDLNYLVSVENVLKNLTEGNIDKGIFPIENSNGGVVIEAIYAMARYQFEVEEIFEIDIKHCLLVKKGVNTDNITKITSHDQALKQCRMYLKRRWEGIDIEAYEDTAKAARDLSQGTLGDNVAVIAPAKCAELYDLDILEEGVQDLKFNFTSFVVSVKK